jgi:ubiquitin-conjugating enzyme E2 M
MEEQVNEEKESYTAGKIQFKKELPDLNNLSKNVPQAKLIKKEDQKDFMSFKVEYTPEKDSLWYGGKYVFSFTVPDTYPFNPPKVLCETKIYHPNIDFDGNVCLNILKEDWKPTMNVMLSIAGVYYLFTEPNPNDPLNHEVAKLMRDNISQFKENVKRTLRGGYQFGQQFPKFTKY